MSKNKINLIIDALMLLAVGGIVGIGLLIHYVLIPGQQRWAVYGRNVDLTLLGLDRHQWGAIHYWIGVVFFALIVLHVVLHWRMVVALARQLIPSRGGRVVVAILLAAVVVFLVIFPAVVKPEVSEGGRGAGRGPGDGHGGRIRSSLPE